MTMPGAARDGGEGIVGDIHLQVGRLMKQLVQTPYQSTPACQPVTLFMDVGRQIGRRLFQRPFYRVHDHRNRLFDRLAGFLHRSP